MLNRLKFVFSFLILTTLMVSSSLAIPAEAMSDRAAKTVHPTKLPASHLTITHGPAAPAAPSGGVIAIPASAATVKLDGICNEYGAALVQPWADGGVALNGKVYLMHDSSNLYICLEGIQGSLATRFGSLYLDPQGNGLSYTFAQQDDYAMHVGILGGALSSFHGTNVVNGYVPDSTIPPFWSGVAASSPASGRESIEWKVEYGRFGIKVCETVFNLAAYHHWFAAVGNDYGWPSNRWFDQPRTWQAAILQGVPCGNLRGTIAYVYRGNTPDASSFFSLLTGQGYTVTLVPLSAVTTTNFTVFQLIIIADDTGSLNNWGTPPLTSAQVDQINIANKPVIGVGEGGYAYFGQLGLFIGWPQGWHGPMGAWTKAVGAPPSYFTTPFSIVPNPVQVYTPTVNSVGIYLLPKPLPADVIPVGLETPLDDHASLIMQNCKLLWGGSGNPNGMSGDGRDLFINSVEYMKNFQCPPAATPVDPACLSLVKTATPASGTTVNTGDVIRYQVTYKYQPTCPELAGTKLRDVVPLNTIYVPGSASDGISPAADGSLTWPVTLTGVSQTKEFRVRVSDSVCNSDRRVVFNRAQLLSTGHLPFDSNVVSNPVKCGPVGFPNQQPPYAEEEVGINPYPLILGKPSKIDVKLTNFSASPIPVTVEFQTSPDKFGIGLTYNTFATSNTIIPAFGSMIVSGFFTPAASGHYCIQIKVSSPGLPPIFTQRNIDVTEELVAGKPDILNFLVGNPLTTTATVQLVVINTCPGWSASITLPPGGTLINMAPGEVRPAQLTVTPPNPVTLGSGCHIDVQGWIGDRLIGGIRKLDVPPVNLPTDVNPPWEEQEITFQPDPPVANKPGKVCIFLQNPTSTAKNVSVNFQWADFGAGVPFTNIGTLNLVLPPGSANNYCINWTPVATGTTHRCILVTLKVPGYQPQRSQHNVDIIRLNSLNLGLLNIPFTIGNPDAISHTLTLTATMLGVNPIWLPHILPDPPPDELGPGAMMMFHLMFEMPVAAGRVPAVLPPNPLLGSESKVQVTELLDGQPAGGFTIQLTLPGTYLPMVGKH